ncbi:MAG: IPT/TIG domain-containing protein [Patescibacteria group bacterium]
MRNSQKGFIVPLVIVLVALVIGGGFYFKNTQFSQRDSTQAPVSNRNIPAEQVTNQVRPVISLISPSSTTPQTLVTITGSGFVGNNDIKFTSMSQPTIVAYACGARAKNNNTSILFSSGPSSQDPFVSDCKGGAGVKGIVLQPGLYNVSVINDNGISNSVSFTINSTSTQSAVGYGDILVTLTDGDFEDSSYFGPVHIDLFADNLLISSIDEKGPVVSFPNLPFGVYSVRVKVEGVKEVTETFIHKEKSKYESFSVNILLLK